MAIRITATEANRKFSAILRGVREGKRYVITSRGEPVAELSAPQRQSRDEIERRRKAWEEYEKELDKRPVLNLPHITRDEMHER